MALPKFRKSKSKTMMRRRANDKRTLPTVSIDPDTGEYKLPHRISPSGMYKGKTIIRQKDA